MVLVLNGLLRSPCDVFIDTMGVGYAYPFVRLLTTARVFSYTHYPIVQQDMLNVVTSG